MALAAARFFHLAAILLLFGSALFPYYAIPTRQQARLPAGIRRIEILAAITALAGAVAWLMFTTAAMTDTPADAVSAAALWRVLSQTGFGNVSLPRLCVAAMACGISLWPRRAWADRT